MSRTLNVKRITCELCGDITSPGSFTEVCVCCLSDTFTVAFINVNFGIDCYNVEDSLDQWDSDFGEAVYWTRSERSLRSVSGRNVREFLRLPDERRRSLYLTLKRKEHDARLLTGERRCRRCGIIHKPYANQWNKEGFCSRKCREVTAKEAMNQKSRK